MERLAGRIMLLGGARRALLAFLAGAFGVLALPPFSFFAALFVSFTLLVWLLDGVGGGPLARLRNAFAIGWMFGWGYFVAGLWWLGHALMIDAEEFAWALPLAVLGLPAFLALYYGLAAMVARLFWSDGMGRIAALAFGFGLGEWLRSFLATGFPWNAVGYGIMPMPLMMQSAHLVGLFGISALAVFVFCTPALLATRRGLLPGAAIAIALFAAHLGYGAYALTVPETPVRGGEVTVRLVQPRIDQAQKLDDGSREAVFAEHLKLSTEALKEGGKRPDIIVWPETSVPYILTQNHEALARIADMLEPGQVLLAGAVRAEDMGPGLEPRYYNSIYVIDDAGQIVGAVGDRKYTMATTETVINMIRRFSTDRRDDILEAVRRIVADVLLGNGDNHLKNWSFIFPEPGQVRLSPAYDIVPTFLFIPGDRMALRFVGTHQFEIVNLHRFERVASFVQVDPKWIAREVKATVQRALDLWPMAAPELLGEERGNRIIERLSTLQLVRETRA